MFNRINGISPILTKTYNNGSNRYSYGQLPLGDEGVKMTINLMSFLAHKDKKSSFIKELAAKIKRVAKSQLEMVKMAHEWVVNNVDYIKDGKNEVVAAPRHLGTWLKQGDCDCMSTFLVSLLKAMGFEKTYFKTIAHKQENANIGDPFTHVYVMATIPELNITIPLDPVMEHYGFGHEHKPIRRERIFAV